MAESGQSDRIPRTYEYADCLLCGETIYNSGAAWGGHMRVTHEYPARLTTLLREATMPPWIRPWASLEVHAPGADDIFGRGLETVRPAPDTLQAQANIDLAVAAVNWLAELMGLASMVHHQMEVRGLAAPPEPPRPDVTWENCDLSACKCHWPSICDRCGCTHNEVP